MSINKIKEKVISNIKSKLSNALFIIGLFVVSIGIYWIYPQAGIISAGLFLILIAWLLS